MWTDGGCEITIKISIRVMGTVIAALLYGVLLYPIAVGLYEKLCDDYALTDPAARKLRLKQWKYRHFYACVSGRRGIKNSPWVTVCSSRFLFDSIITKTQDVRCQKDQQLPPMRLKTAHPQGMNRNTGRERRRYDRTRAQPPFAPLMHHVESTRPQRLITHASPQRLPPSPARMRATKPLRVRLEKNVRSGSISLV